MRLILHGKNMDVTEALDAYVEGKLGAALKWPAEEADVQVSLSVVGHKPLHKVEITLRLPGTTIRAEEASPDMYESIDRAADKMKAQLRRWKGKLRRTGVRLGEYGAAPQEEADGFEAEDTERFRVERVKSIELKPVTLEEAILQMNLLDHAFYLFMNADTNRTELVYRRKDGTYGLINAAV